MIAIYKSLSSKKRIVFGTRFKDGRIRVNIQDTYRENEPLYLIPELSSKSVFRLSDFRTQIFNYPKRDIIRINKWPKEIFKKAN
jgi:hypothetical protein